MGSGDLISRIYSSFRGVDFRGDEINLVRSPDSLNVWKDYKETESIRTRPAMKLLSEFEDTVWGVFFYNDEILVHSGTKLYKVVNGVKTQIYPSDGIPEESWLYYGLNEAPSQAFISNNILFLKDGKQYIRYESGEAFSALAWEGHVYMPTTTIGGKPSGGGTKHEDVNMLSTCRKNSFIGDGESTVFHLDVPEFINFAEGGASATTMRNSVVINGEAVGITSSDEEVGDGVYKITWNYDEGTIEIYPAPPAPLTDGQDNVVLTFCVDNSSDRKKILGCTLLETFDNRVFFGGNPDYPNTIWHSSLNDPTYVSDLDYYHEGLDTSMVKGIVAGNNNLWVFKEPSQANTTVFYHTPTIDDEYGKIYPNTHSSVSTGCVAKAINFNDDIVFFSDRGMEGISGDITSEQVVAHRSSLVDRKLMSEAEEDYKNMILVEWEGYLIAFVGDKAYLADSRAMFTNEDHNEYEWFYWEMGKKITCATVNKGVLYLGTEDGVYTLNDFDGAVESYWVTPKDKFKHPQYLKTTNKRGCVVEALGDITIYAKTDKDDGWDEEKTKIGTHTGIIDAFVSRIKRKKFKDIQLKFYSKTRFSLETATLECFIGGYIKR